jgi:hypothetical protein
VNDDLEGIDIGPEQVPAPKPAGRNSLGLAIGVVLFASSPAGRRMSGSTMKTKFGQRCCRRRRKKLPSSRGAENRLRRETAVQ